MRKLKITELNRISTEEFKEAEKLPLIVVLDQVRSLYNVGSVFRSSDAFRVESIYLCGITATPPNAEIHKTALGAELTIPWDYERDTTAAIDRLHEQGYQVLAVEQVEGAIPLNHFQLDPGKRYALVFGNEVDGVSQEAVDRCDGAIEIPQQGTKHSLNVAVSGGVVLWELFKQWNL